MLNQSYSPENLKKTYAKSTYGYKSKKDIKENHNEIELISESIKNRQLKDIPLSPKIINGKTVYTPSDIPHKILLIQTNENIKRIYKTKQADRHSTIKQIIQLLTEPTPFTLLKLDIKEFYESINRNSILSELNNNDIISPTTKHIVKTLLKSTAIKNERGLPRGLSLSATLSEIYMRAFDKEISCLPGVYFYSRYVDDIIIFSYQENIKEIRKKAERLLKEKGMQLNSQKSVAKNVVDCRCKPNCTCPLKCKCSEKCICSPETEKNVVFDYLGYQFTCPDITKKRFTQIDLATKKKQKIKNRIIKSILDYINKGDLQLLKNRMVFLSGNYVILKHTSKGKPLKGGIYYNYPLLSTTKANNTTNAPQDMKDLTIFLRSCIEAKNHSFGSKLKARLPRSSALDISALSFEAGYMKRITTKFSADEIRKIKRRWQ